MIYLDNAATTGKKPMMVINAVETALKELSANPGRGGHSPSIKASEAIYKVRKQVADMFGASGEDRVIFTPSCTASLNYAIKGVLNKGDGLVISSMEHNAVLRPADTVRRMGVDVSVAEVIFSDPAATVRSFKRAIKPNTKAVVSTHASNVTGEIMPIAEIGALCKERGILFIVDAAQTAGVLPINVREMNIDFLAIAPHKGLYAPMGTGILIAEAPINYPLIEGGTGVKSASPMQPEEYPERMESGTMNLSGIMGISAGISFVNQKGINNLYKSELDLIKRLYNGLSKIPGIIVYTPFPKDGEFTPVLSFNIRGIESSRVADMLNRYGIAVRAGIHCAPLAHKRLGTIESGTVRVSTSAFNNRQDIALLLDRLKVISDKNRR